MGIKSLNSFIKKNCNNTLRKISFNDLRGKKIVVDASIYLYKFLENDMLVQNIYLMSSLFRYYNIAPLFVFDGKPPPEKMEVLKHRQQKRISSRNRLIDLEKKLDFIQNNTEKKMLMRKMQILKRNSISIKSKDYREIKQFLDNYGIQWIIAKGEADVLCASIVKTGKAFACLSEDMDLFVYGCPRVLRYMSLIHHSFVLYDLNEILSTLHIDFPHFQLICILSGTDYNHSSKNVYFFYNLYKLFQYSRNTNFHQWLGKKIHITGLDSIITLFNVTIETQDLHIQFNNIQKKDIVNQLKSHNFIFV